jgi:hypothetical protein
VDGRIAVAAILGCSLILFLVTALPRLLDRRRNGAPSAGEVTTDQADRPDGIVGVDALDRLETTADAPARVSTDERRVDPRAG